MTDGDAAFTYGLSASPDSRHVAYHKDYQVYVADAGGESAQDRDWQPLQLRPQWSPDGQWLMFVSGEHYNCHPCIVRPDGSDFRKLADRGGYSGVTTVYDVYDFHGGSSDVPVWAPDGKGVYYTRQFGEAVELMHVTLGGEVTRLTESAPGVTHYHPKPSPDGNLLAFGATRTGTRQLYVMPSQGGGSHPNHRGPGRAQCGPTGARPSPDAYTYTNLSSIASPGEQGRTRTYRDRGRDGPSRNSRVDVQALHDKRQETLQDTEITVLRQSATHTTSQGTRSLSTTRRRSQSANPERFR